MLSILPSFLSFDCSSLTNESFCEAYGCMFISGICTGSFVPTCSGTCFYVEANAPDLPGDGSLGTPFANVTDALKKVSTVQVKFAVYNIIILPKSHEDEFHLIGTLAYDMQMTINLYSYFPTIHPTIFVSQLAITFSKVSVLFKTLQFKTKVADYASQKTITFNTLVTFLMDDVIFKDFHALANDQTNRAFLIFSRSSISNITNIQADNSPSLTISSSQKIILNMSNVTLTNTVYKQMFFNCLLEGTTLSNITISNVTQGTQKIGYGLFQVAVYNMSNYQGIATMKNFTVRNFNGQLMSNLRLLPEESQSSTYILSKFNIEGVDLGTQSLLFNFKSPTSVTIKDSSFQRISNGLMVIKADDVVETFSMENCLFKNLKNAELQNLQNVSSLIQSSMVGLCGTFTDVFLSLKKITFEGISYNCLSLIRSNFDFREISIDYLDTVIQPFQAWIDQEKVGPMITLTDTSFGQITDSSFVNYNREEVKDGAAIYFQGDTTAAITIRRSSFQNLKAKRGPAIFAEIPYMSLFVDGCTFEGNEATVDGGAIFLSSGYWSSSFTVQIAGSLFKENFATQRGGAVYASNVLFELSNCNLVSNKAENGGAIFWEISKQDSALVTAATINNNQFYMNSASNGGGAIRLIAEISRTSVVNNTFINNVAIGSPNDNNELLQNPTRIRINLYNITKYYETESYADMNEFVQEIERTEGMTLLQSSDHSPVFKVPHKTGQKFYFLIESQVLGENGEVFQAANGDQIRVAFEDNSDCFTRGEIEFKFVQGLAYLSNNLRLFGKINTQRILTLSLIRGRIPNLEPLEDFKFQILVDFVECEPGEIYDTFSQVCAPCEPGSVSFGDPYTTTECTLCLEETFSCLGGTMVSASQGYWRTDSNALNVYKCQVESACLGGVSNNEYNPHGICAPSYQGLLCASCAEGYAKAEGGECIDCQGSGGSYLRFVFFLITQFLFLFFLLKTHLSQLKMITENTHSISFEHESRNIMTRIAINFMQTFCLLSNMDLEWPSKFLRMSNPVSQIISSDKSSLQIDCFIEFALNRQESNHFIKFLLLALRPFFTLIFSLIYLTKPWRRSPSLKAKKNEIILILILVFFLAQPGIVQMGIESFKCQSFLFNQTEQRFMQQDLNLDCDSSVYKSHLGIFVWPFFILWGIVFPLGLVIWILRAQKEKLLKSKFFFFFTGYRQKHFYWELYIYARKTILIILTLFTHSIQAEQRVWVIIFILIVMLVIQLMVKPYENKSFNELETLSISCLILIVGFEMYILQPRTSSNREAAFISLAFLSFVGFILRYCWMMLSTLRKKSLLQRRTNKVFPLNIVENSPQHSEKKSGEGTPVSVVERTKNENDLNAQEGHIGLKIIKKYSEELETPRDLLRCLDSTTRDFDINTPSGRLTSRSEYLKSERD